MAKFVPLKGGSFENEALENEKRRPQNSKTKHLNQVEAADASAPPKVHKIHSKVL